MQRVFRLILRLLVRLLHGMSRTHAIHAGTGKPAAADGGKAADGPSGFLWKPASDSDGKLVVLTPEGLTGKIESVVLKDESGRVIESGRSSGVANGDREHFRFRRAGGDYPPNVTVEIRMENGEIKRYRVEDPSRRVD
jgi:hypothetical protein